MKTGGELQHAGVLMSFCGNVRVANALSQDLMRSALQLTQPGKIYREATVWCCCCC